jgi:hypothetical protein
MRDMLEDMREDDRDMREDMRVDMCEDNGDMREDCLYENSMGDEGWQETWPGDQT